MSRENYWRRQFFDDVIIFPVYFFFVPLRKWIIASKILIKRKACYFRLRLTRDSENILKTHKNIAVTMTPSHQEVLYKKE